MAHSAIYTHSSHLDIGEESDETVIALCHVMLIDLHRCTVPQDHPGASSYAGSLSYGLERFSTYIRSTYGVHACVTTTPTNYVLFILPEEALASMIIGHSLWSTCCALPKFHPSRVVLCSFSFIFPWTPEVPFAL